MRRRFGKRLARLVAKATEGTWWLKPLGELGGSLMEIAESSSLNRCCLLLVCATPAKRLDSSERFSLSSDLSSRRECVRTRSAVGQ